ncbi:MAG: 3-dehydroquinate synthase [Nitrosomonadaceae bacterium]|nr:3-dehydroquinate synthase [Nitrosomonadaceae bacterium]|tara:strand:- start:3470 stop:4570 length:1101 start_codon:yes stop_codon:yes gene_type:complete
MQTILANISTDSGQHNYPIHVGSNILNKPSLIFPYLAQKKVAIVTNTTVAPLYLNALIDNLKNNEINSVPIILPDGEEYKNWEILNNIFDVLLANNCERNTTIIALGGGVIGDITGFAASTYLRGVPFIQIPTTLLAQVDSSIGGKTGINHELGKNLIGSFYQPKVVLADCKTLDTLPNREFISGIAEIIKYGLIRDHVFFEWLEKNMGKILEREDKILGEAIERSCKNKVEIVAADEREQGVRAILNLGHTFGHAIENAMGYGTWLHGEAVAAGTVLAAELSERMHLIERIEVERIKSIFLQAELPISVPNLNTEQYLNLMGRDKKVKEKNIRFVLLQGIGKATICSDVPINVLIGMLDEYSTNG